MLWILIVLMLAMLGIGIFALRGAIKNSFKDVALGDSKARLARKLLGEEGYRYFVGILGVLFILAPFVLMVGIFGESFRSGGSKTDLITISIASEDPTMTSGLRATEDQLKMKYDMLGDREFDTYQHISLKNNYRSTLPDIIWKMKNLESIDLTHNKFKELPLDEFGKLPKLKQLILDGNPIEPAYLEKVRSELNEIQVIKNDVMTP